MRSWAVVSASLLLLLLPISATSDLLNFGSLLTNHVLFGPSGPPSNAQSEVKRQGVSPALIPDSQCTNGPLTRSCWANGFSVADDFDLKWPSLGKTRSYEWTITHQTCNPDGKAPRQCSLVNGQYPGPVLEAGM